MESDNTMKLSPEEHMEVLAILMHMDSLPHSAVGLDFSGNVSDPPPPFHPPSSPFSHHVSGDGGMTTEMREVIFRIAAMQPVHIDPEEVKPPKRRNVRISTDPQSVAARQRRERISERIRILQRLVPGGTKMDTASMLDEAIQYVKFLKRQVQCLQDQRHGDGGRSGPGSSVGGRSYIGSSNYNYLL